MGLVAGLAGTETVSTTETDPGITQSAAGRYTDRANPADAQLNSAHSCIINKFLQYTVRYSSSLILRLSSK